MCKKESVKFFESLINTLISIGADDRETAIRWVIESYNMDDLNDSINYICWNFLDLPNSYIKEFQYAMSNQKRLQKALDIL